MHAHYDYLIIGGGIAGVTAAETIREHNSDVHIAIIEREPYVLYSRVLLPAYLKGRITRSKLFLRTADDFTKKKIDIHHQETVVSIDPQHREIKRENGKVFTYGKLLLSTGGRVKEWGKQEDQHFMYRLQTLDDADRLFAALPSIKNPLVIGSSFISLELAEIFFLNHTPPTVLVRDPYFFGHLLDEQGGQMMHENFLRLGIKVDYDDMVTHINQASTGAEITTKAGKKFPIDAIGVGIGIDRNLNYAKISGIDCMEHGIQANEFLETNQPDIFSAGDVTEYYDSISGRRRNVGNWTNAVLQGKRAGLNMLGQHGAFISVPSYSITNLGFQITALGDTSNHEGAIVRIDKDHKRYARFFFKGDSLAGAVLINRFKDKAHLSMLIEKQVNIAQWRGQLADNSFDIHTISVVM
ncbi:MAG: FAD/NAD(P)-binding oxidoreductase [bacterium]|nr:FAD/NAD(P)-binding oxidoreductase [bacterium]MDZ4285402.1 FAD/NAD(P)-binding oxidoreductase [Candidatus Sungbacteria bacterium]